jgi:para-aminobenzoate synthetase component 1
VSTTSPIAAKSGASEGSAWFGGLRARGLVEATDDPAALDDGGWWAVLITFEGERRFWRFNQVDAESRPAPSQPLTALSRPGESQPVPAGGPAWRGPEPKAWRSSLDRASYLAGVREIRRRILDGDVYQVNLCRVLTAPLPDADGDGPSSDSGRDGGSPSSDGGSDPWALAERLAAGNPAPYAAVIDVPAMNRIPGTRLVSASPELFLERDGEVVTSGPIKGTGATAADLLPKDDAENVMIVDLVRNDLQRVSRAGTIEVPSLLRVEQHPGLVHLVSTVRGRLRAGVSWADILTATMPPGSVSGAPKSSALRAIADLEPVPRGPYCGAIGFVDADRGQARLAVGIRTFWWERRRDRHELNFGTGAGITWGSDPEHEWAETELKAARLIGLASSQRGNQVSQVSSRATAASRSR